MINCGATIGRLFAPVEDEQQWQQTDQINGLRFSTFLRGDSGFNLSGQSQLQFHDRAHCTKEHTPDAHKTKGQLVVAQQEVCYNDHNDFHQRQGDSRIIQLMCMQLFPEEMEVLYDRPFSAEMLSEDFKIKGGSWYVDEAGWLIGENRRNSAAMVISKGEYFGDVLIEFDAATVLPATRDKPPRQSPRHQRGRNRRPLPQAPLTRASPLTRVLTAQSAVRGGFLCLGLHRRPPEVGGTSGSLARGLLRCGFLLRGICGTGKPVPYKAFQLVVGNGLAHSAGCRLTGDQRRKHKHEAQPLRTLPLEGKLPRNG